MPDGPDPRIESPILRQLYAYWDSRRRGRAMPRRADFEPTEIPALLPHLFLIDVERAQELRFHVRLSGTFIDSVFFRSGKNVCLNEHEVNRRDPARLDYYRKVVNTGRPNVARTQFVDDRQRRYSYERLLLPLSVADEARVDMIVGGLAFEEPIPSPGVPQSSRDA